MIFSSPFISSFTYTHSFTRLFAIIFRLFLLLMVFVVVVDENTSSNAQTFEKPFGPFKQTLPRFCSHRDWAFLFFFCCFSWWRFPTNIFVSFSILSITRIFNFGRICNVFLSCWHNCRQAGIQIPPPTDGWCQVPKRLTFLQNVCTDICVCAPPYVYVL